MCDSKRKRFGESDIGGRWVRELPQNSVGHGSGNMQAMLSFCTCYLQTASISQIYSASIVAGFAHNRMKEVLADIATSSRVRLKRKAPAGEVCFGETFAGAWNSLDCSEVRGP